MRPTSSLLALAALSACAAPGGSADRWHDIQRERIDRLHKPLNPEAALAAVLLQRPQDPARRSTPLHIDQREPRRVDGLRPLRSPAATATVIASVGVGTVAVRIAGTLLDDRADATFAKIAVDQPGGAAIHVEAWSSEKELFAGRRINDGVDPANADAGLFGVQAFPHVRLDAWQVGGLRIPVRVGAFADWQQLDHDQAGVAREWLSVGPKLQLEPVWRLLEGGGSSLEIFGRVGGEVGLTCFTEEYRNGDDRDVTSRWSGELGAGLRTQFGRWQGELGYQVHHTTFGAIDSDLYGSRSRTELQRQQIFLSLGTQL